MWFVDLILVAPSNIRCLILEEVVNINIKVLVSHQLVKKISYLLSDTCRPVMARITYTNDLESYFNSGINLVATNSSLTVHYAVCVEPPYAELLMLL